MPKETSLKPNAVDTSPGEPTRSSFVLLSEPLNRFVNIVLVDGSPTWKLAVPLGDPTTVAHSSVKLDPISGSA
jgi:hypothetical protein